MTPRPRARVKNPIGQAPFQGALLGVDRGVIYGWAADAAGQPLAILLEGDGMPLALARSCMVLPKATPLPSPRWRQRGFLFYLGEERVAAFGTLRARVANTEWLLEGTLQPAQTRPSLAPDTLWAAVGQQGLGLNGWLLPDPLINGTERVLAFCEARCVASADLHPATPREEAQGAPQRALHFALSLPLSLADGTVHAVRLITSAGRELPGSPFKVHLPATATQQWLAALPLEKNDRALLAAMTIRQAEREPASIPVADYAAWKARFGTPPDHASQSEVLVVIGPHARGPEALHKSLQSLLAQQHTAWRALVWDSVPQEIADPRLIAVPRAQWRTYLPEALAKLRWTGVLPAGDVWHPALLSQALRELESGARITYCDAEDETGGPPWFKPDWCPETFLSLPLLAHGFVCASALLHESTADPAHWPTQAVIALGGTRAKGIAHLPHVLHTRGDGLSASAPVKPVTTRDASALRAPLIGAFQLRKWQAAKNEGTNLWASADPAQWPAVTLIIPTKDKVSLLRTCLESLRITDYPTLHVHVVDNQSTCEETLAYLKSLAKKGITVIRWPHAFNYAALHNDVVPKSRTELVGLMNNDVRILDKHWLKHLVRGLMRPGVGAVGAKLLWPNHMVQHGGVVVGLLGGAGHIGNLWHANDPGYHHMNHITRSASAVTAACLLMRKKDYQAVGGMDAEAFPIAFNDVDLCLKLRARGKRILWCAEAVLEHAESASRGQDDKPERQARAAKELAALKARWGSTLAADPFYNPNLNLDQYSHTGLAIPPRHSRPGP